MNNDITLQYVVLVQCRLEMELPLSGDYILLFTCSEHESQPLSLSLSLSSRPPGHHAECEFSMGFCHFNNVAIAAQYAIDKLGLER